MLKQVPFHNHPWTSLDSSDPNIVSILTTKLAESPLVTDFHCDKDGTVSGVVAVPKEDVNAACQIFTDLEDIIDIGYDFQDEKTCFEVDFFQKNAETIQVQFKRTLGCAFAFNDFFNQFMSHASLESCTWSLTYDWELKRMS